MTVKKGVQRIYTEVSPTYDLINHLMTFGWDTLWRRQAARRAAGASPRLVLDICCGTGDLAREFSRRLAPFGPRIIGVDFSFPMLLKARTKCFAVPTDFVLGDVSRLPFPDSCFDVVGISFATRNLKSDHARLCGFFEEFLRVLKPEGLLIHLETSQPHWRLWRSLFHRYVKHVVQPLGNWLSGASSGYRYLAYTVPRFLDAEKLSALLREAGFRNVECRPLLWHIAALHTAEKPRYKPARPDANGSAR